MEIQVWEEIGAGSSGIVFSAKDSLGNSYALKDQDLITLADLQCGHLDHPNLLRYVEVTANDRDMSLGTPIFNVTTLSSPLGVPLDVAIMNKTLSLEDKYNLIKDIISGMYHMHINGYVHRDLELNNVIITEEKRAVLIDFGVSMYARTKLNKPKSKHDDEFPTIYFDLKALGRLIYNLFTDTHSHSLKIKDVYKSIGVEDPDDWAQLTSDLIEERINSSQLAAKFGIEGQRLPLEPLILVRDLKKSYEEILNAIPKDLYWLPYYAIVHLTTVYATTNLSLDKAMTIVLGMFDGIERAPITTSDIIDQKIVRHIMIQSMDDAIKVHDLLKEGDPNYYYLDLHQSFVTPLVNFGCVMELR